MQINFADAKSLVVDILTNHGVAGRAFGDRRRPSRRRGRRGPRLRRTAAGARPSGAPQGQAGRSARSGSRRRSPNAALIDGAGNNGYVTSILGIDKAIELARRDGVGIVGIRDTWFSGRLAYYVERAARQGLIAFHTANTMARVAPYGGIDRIFGTNPLAFAFPCDPHPLVIDFGTGTTTWGDVLLRQKLGKPLEPGTAVDAAGAPTPTRPRRSMGRSCLGGGTAATGCRWWFRCWHPLRRQDRGRRGLRLRLLLPRLRSRAADALAGVQGQSRRARSSSWRRRGRRRVARACACPAAPASAGGTRPSGPGQSRWTTPSTRRCSPFGQRSPASLTSAAARLCARTRRAHTSRRTTCD